MEPDFLTWVKRAQALSATGVHFAASDFDRERYEELVVLTHRMLARLGDVPLSSVNGLFNDIGQGYATPKVDARGATAFCPSRESYRCLLQARRPQDCCRLQPGTKRRAGRV